MAIYLEDLTANNNDLTNSGAAEVTTSLPFAQSTIAVDLEASESDYLYAADSASLDISGDWTLEGWFKWETLPANANIVELVSKLNYKMYAYNDSGTYQLHGNVLNQGPTLQDDYYVVITPSTGVWYHYAVTCTVGNASATTFEFFVNGSSAGNGTAVISQNVAETGTNAEALTIGRRADAAERYFDGVIDDVRVWNDARSAAEINNNKSIRLNGDESNLVAYYPFEIVIPPPRHGFVNYQDPAIV